MQRQSKEMLDQAFTWLPRGTSVRVMMKSGEDFAGTLAGQGYLPGVDFGIAMLAEMRGRVLCTSDMHVAEVVDPRTGRVEVFA